MKNPLLLIVLTTFLLLNVPVFSDSKYKAYKGEQRQSGDTNYGSANISKPGQVRLLPFDPSRGEEVAQEIKEDIIERRDDRREYGF